MPQGEFDRALARMGGDREMYAEILDYWLKNLETAEGELRAAVANGPETTERYFHSLKSAAAAVGAEALSAYAARQEELTGSHGPFAVEQFLPEFSERVAEARAATLQYLRKAPDGHGLS